MISRLAADPRLRRALNVLLPLAVIVGVFGFVLPRFADYSQVWSVLQGMSSRDLALVLAAALINVLTFGPPWMAALPGLSYWHSMVMTQATTAASNVVPGGDAVGLALSWRMLKVWGFPGRAVALALIVTASSNQVVNVALPLVALVGLWVEGEASGVLQLAALAALALLIVLVATVAAVLRGEAPARSMGLRLERWATSAARLVRRGPFSGWDERLVRFRAESIELLRRRWYWILGAQFLGHLTVWLVLVVCLRATGVDAGQVSLIEILAAWSLIRLLTAIPITPGGVGIVELGLTGMLVGFGGADAGVVAAVLLYRVMTFAPPVATGAVAGLIWTRLHPGGLAQPEGSG